MPPVASLFASFLGFNPIKTILDQLSGAGIGLGHPDLGTLTGKSFFPNLMSDPFHHGLVVVFGAAAVMSVLAAVASWFAGGKYVHADEPVVGEIAAGVVLPEEETA
jgi:hypothetical protein